MDNGTSGWSNTGGKTEILSLDIIDLVKDEFTAEHAIFHVLNASNKQDSNDHSDEPDSSGEE